MKVKRYSVGTVGGISCTVEDTTGKFVKFEDHKREVDRFQTYCKHDCGRLFNGDKENICAICEWDTDKCQHKNEHGKFCSQCGEALK